MHVPPGGRATQHIHQDLDDSFYLLAGRVSVRCGKSPASAGPGEYVTMPHGVAQTFLVVGDKPAIMLQVHQDDSVLRFVKAVGRPATALTLPPAGMDMDFDAVYRVAAETGQRVVGPPMSAEEAEEIAGSESAV